jgi:hypothetical protein
MEFEELLKMVLESSPCDVIQITKMSEDEYRIGWESKKWPYVAGVAGETLTDALTRAKEKMER